MDLENRKDLHEQGETAADRPVPMPALTRPSHGFYHTADSALANLAALGIKPDRISVRKAGPGWARSRVIDQSPQPGQPIGPADGIELTVEGEGLFYALPSGMREGGDERSAGIDQLASLLDDPLEKLGHFVREGALYFDVQPDNMPGCSRWIRLFGLEPDDWPVSSWYPLAVLLPSLAELAGREDGFRAVLRDLLHLNLFSLSFLPGECLLSEGAETRLAAALCTLGFDSVLGRRKEDTPQLEIVIGPVSLDDYQRFQTDTMRQQLARVLDLVIPWNLSRSVKWRVGDAATAPRLGCPERNAVLGINSWMGSA